MTSKSICGGSCGAAGESHTAARRTIHSDKQVVSLAEIEVGKTYEEHHSTRSEARIAFTVLSKPYKKRVRDWRVKVEEHLDEYDRTTTISLADYGVVPYVGDSGEIWNTTNWISLLDEKEGKKWEKKKRIK